MASGFPIGLGKSGCLCGAVSGGQMALGMIYGRVEGESMNEKMFKNLAAFMTISKMNTNQLVVE